MAKYAIKASNGEEPGYRHDAEFAERRQEIGEWQHRTIMSEDFDPYYRWLGIRDSERPPNHYRLLGLEPFEAYAEVIMEAADRQMQHVRRHQLGQYAELSQRLLNEIATAKLCLLDALRKQEYDRRLARTRHVGTVGVANSPPGLSATTPGNASCHGDSNRPIDLEDFLCPTESDEPIDLDETQSHLLDTDDERAQTVDKAPEGSPGERDTVLSHSAVCDAGFDLTNDCLRGRDTVLSNSAEPQHGSRDEPPGQPESGARPLSGRAASKDGQTTTDNDMTRTGGVRPPRPRHSSATLPPSSATAAARSQPSTPTRPSRPSHKGTPPLPSAPNIQIDTAAGEPSGPGSGARKSSSSVSRSKAYPRVSHAGAWEKPRRKATVPPIFWVGGILAAGVLALLVVSLLRQPSPGMTFPVIEFTSPKDRRISWKEGVPMSLRLRIREHDQWKGHDLKYSLVENHEAATVTQEGLFTWEPGEGDGGAPPGKPHPFKIRVQGVWDGEPNSELLDFEIRVIRANEPPRFLNPRLNEFYPSVGKTWEHRFEASDPKNEPLTYTLDEDAKEAFPGCQIDQGTGYFTWTPGPDLAEKSRSGRVIVTDPAGLPDRFYLILNITP